ncbi:hypothetical protein KST23_07065 [Fusobacterium nucleatum]|uniref:hypothetical protein n=1 Tax=Fusobacterium nucleatum TaxID=851 RepID=UPI003D078BC4
MKKFLKTILLLCAISSLVYAEETTQVVAETSTGMSAEEQKEAMNILKRMREKIEKEDAERARAEEQARMEAEKQAKEAEEQAKIEAERRAQEDAEAQKILDEKVQAEETKEEVEAKAEEIGVEYDKSATLEEIEAMIKAKKAAEVAPKTEKERLEATRKKSLEKLDFYERVVRSVAREENEISDYYEIMGEEKQRSSVTLKPVK